MAPCRPRQNGRPHHDLHVVAGVAAGVLQQVTHGAAQQPLVTPDDEAGSCALWGTGLAQALGLDRGLHASGFLGRQRKQVHRLFLQRVLRSIQPAGQQHLFHQRVEFADVRVDLLAQPFALGRGSVLQHRHRHLQARQR